MNVSELFMPVAIGIIMFGIGLNLQFKDFHRVLVKPRSILTGLVCQMFFLPVVAFMIIYFWPIDPVYKVGFILIAACPGGSSSNLVTHMVNGRVALSISLTSFNSFLILFSIPLLINLAMEIFMGEKQEVKLDFLNTISEVIYTVIGPVILGIGVRNQFPDFALRLKKPLRYILPGILLLVFSYEIFFDKKSGKSSQIMEHLNLFIPALVLNISTIFAGYYLPKTTKINHGGRYTIAIEMGLQNSALAIFIANEVIKNEAMSMVAVIYSSFTFFTTLGIAYFLKRFFKDK